MDIHILVNDADESIRDYQGAITLAGGALVSNEDIYQDYIQACIEREKDFPTGLLLSNDIGIAIPHANSALVRHSGISVVRLKNKVAFGLMEDASLTVECKLIFNLALASGEQHLVILRKLVKAFQNSAFIEECLTITKDELTHKMHQLVQDR